MPARRTRFAVEVGSGDRRRALIALRDKLAAAIDGAEGSHVAPLAKQLADVLAALDAIKEPEASTRDDLAKLRAARRAAAQVQGPPAAGELGGD